jgi:hypothetical protein
MFMVKDRDEDKARLRVEIASLGLSNNAFARLARVSERSVRLWLEDKNDRGVPAYVFVIIKQQKRIQELEATIRNMMAVNEKP